eukprot:364771-Chlamydomonas_euryale.AAC.4
MPIGRRPSPAPSSPIIPPHPSPSSPITPPHPSYSSPIRSCLHTPPTLLLSCLHTCCRCCLGSARPTLQMNQFRDAHRPRPSTSSTTTWGTSSGFPYAESASSRRMDPSAAPTCGVG